LSDEAGIVAARPAFKAQFLPETVSADTRRNPRGFPLSWIQSGQLCEAHPSGAARYGWGIHV